MATAKKPTTKAAKTVTVVKSLEELRGDLAAKQNDLLDAQKSHRSGELVNPRILGTTRKEIARLHTAIRAAERASAKESK